MSHTCHECDCDLCCGQHDEDDSTCLICENPNDIFFCVDCALRIGEEGYEEAKNPQLWFYVPDYLSVKEVLQGMYTACDVEEHSAELGRVNETDADVVVAGTSQDLARFRKMLRATRMKGLMIEGKPVDAN
jgi:hypothetical protein